MPVYQAAGAKSQEVEAQMRRRALDDWLDAEVAPLKRARMGDALGVVAS